MHVVAPVTYKHKISLEAQEAQNKITAKCRKYIVEAAIRKEYYHDVVEESYIPFDMGIST